MDSFVKWDRAIPLYVLVDLTVGILRFLYDLLLIHHMTIEAHSSHIADTSASWISNIVYGKYRKSPFVSNLQGNLMRHRFLLQCMQLFITVFTKPFASSLARNQVKSLVKQKNSAMKMLKNQKNLHDWRHKNDWDEGDRDAETSPVSPPKLVISIVNINHYILNELQINVYRD